MPDGDEVTVPMPVPGFVTVIEYVSSVNVAVTVVAAVIVTTHVVFTPLQPPPVQPLKTDPVAGAAVRVTIVPESYSLHPAPHAVPVGAGVTVPVPVPLVTSVSSYVLSANVAVTVFAASIVTSQAVVPVHAPL